MLHEPELLVLDEPTVGFDCVLPQLALGNVPRGVTVLELDPPAKRIIGAVLPYDASATAHTFAAFLSERMRGANPTSC